jgi:hypothetical protein
MLCCDLSPSSENEGRRQQPCRAFITSVWSVCEGRPLRKSSDAYGAMSAVRMTVPYHFDFPRPRSVGQTDKVHWNNIRCLLSGLVLRLDHSKRDHADFRAHRNRVVRALGLAHVAIVSKRLAGHGLACYLDFARCTICNTCAIQPQHANMIFGQFRTTVRRLKKAIMHCFF